MFADSFAFQNRHRLNNIQPARGFTLLEMMIAVAILAILFSVVYSVINSAVNARMANQTATERLIKLHRGLTLVEQDVDHMIARFSQFPNEDWRPSLDYMERSEGVVLSFSRHGWPITQNQNASSLARVGYELALEEKTQTEKNKNNEPSYKLYRVYWRNIDSLQIEPSRKRVILRGIKKLTFRFLDENQKWGKEWPKSEGTTGSEEFNEDIAGSDMGSFQRLPRAIEMTLDMHGIGEIKRLFILPEGHGM